MADGYARAGGTPAACFVITGPGLTNIATAMGQALNDSVPMLVISSNGPRDRQGKGLGDLHEMRDQSGFSAHLARWSRRIEAPEDLPEALDAAMETFASARPGPVHIEIPLDVVEAEAPDVWPAPRPPAAPPQPSAVDIAEVVMRLSAARAPALVLGGGAVGMGARRATALAERLQAPTALTTNARGLLPPGHPLNIAGRLHSAPVRDLLETADAVLAVGTEFSATDWDFYGGGALRFGDGALIRIDIDPEQLGRNAAPSVGLVGDAALFAEGLLEALPRRDAPPPQLDPVRARAAAAVPERFARHQALIDSLWEHLPEAVVIGDSTEPAYQGLIGANPPAPRRWWTSATGFGTLGYALPAAIGAKVADPRRPVVALIGDGGLLFSVGELAAALEANAHIVVVVWNNSGYGEIRDYMKACRIKPEAVDLSPVELQALARAFGSHYARVHGPDFFREALKKAVMRPGPTVLELREEFWF